MIVSAKSIRIIVLVKPIGVLLSVKSIIGVGVREVDRETMA